MAKQRHHEHHRTHRLGWLRAAVLGANDGIVSTASIVLGVAAAHAQTQSVLLAGIAGLVAGAMSMAAGEYVSVSSQADIERADLERERLEINRHPEAEHAEIVHIYIDRGLDHALAEQVATELTAHDALGTHARDELGLSDTTAARPLQAALASAIAFAAGAILPLLMVLIAPTRLLIPDVAAGALLSLVLLGALSARASGAPVIRAASRIAFWGALAMLLTALAGRVFGGGF